MLLYVFSRDGVASVLLGRRGLEGMGRSVEEDGSFRQEEETLIGRGRKEREGKVLDSGCTDMGVQAEVQEELTRGRARAAVPKRTREPEERARIRRTGVELEETKDRRAAEVAERENLRREDILSESRTIR